MSNILKLGVPLVLLVSIYSRAADTNLSILAANVPGHVGGEFRNSYATASSEQAKAKLERLRQGGVPVTLEEFLGRKLLEVRIITDESGGDRAPSLIRELLASLVLQPGVGGPSCDGDPWVYFPVVAVRAYLDYGNGRVGILESDANGRHLFFEDGDGTYWWHRWDASFPRQVRQESSQPDGAANRNQPIRAETNRTSVAAGSDR